MLEPMNQYITFTAYIVQLMTITNNSIQKINVFTDD